MKNKKTTEVYALDVPLSSQQRLTALCWEAKKRKTTYGKLSPTLTVEKTEAICDAFRLKMIMKQERAKALTEKKIDNKHSNIKKGQRL